MIEYNLSVPKAEKSDIISMSGDEFRIITSSPMAGGRQYFLIESKNEDMLLFSLKYGQENVWKRYPTNYSAP